MTLTFRRSATDTAETESLDLAESGIHRDPANHDPITSGSFAQRVVNRVSGMLAGHKESRRGFLTKTAVVGSALAVSPFDFILKPGTAYGYLCGTCTDGWTAFCCTINGGRNTCPAGSFVAGWWKADNAAYCCGSARYIIDCNATCPTQCSCRCAGGSCDNRRTCCNQFRYGQCHTEISCYGPVVCRVATCVPPWQYDKSCTTTVRTDNRTVDHGAPCLTKDCGTPISNKYAALGGPTGVMGPVTQAEHPVGDNRGRRARYRNGNIYWTSTTGAREVRAGRLSAYTAAGGAAVMGYPTSDTLATSDGAWYYNNMERGRVMSGRRNQGNFFMPNPFFARYEELGGIHGNLGAVTSNPRRTKDNKSTVQLFTKGRIYVPDSIRKPVDIDGPIYKWHESQGGIYGRYRYPTAPVQCTTDYRGRYQVFEGGRIYHSDATGAHGLRDVILQRYLALGGPTSGLGLPTSTLRRWSDTIGIYATFEKGWLFQHPTLGTWSVVGAPLIVYVHSGGPTGSLGYPLGEMDPPGTSGGRFQRFQNGRIRLTSDGGAEIVA